MNNSHAVLLLLQLIDQGLMGTFNISCVLIEKPAQVTLNCADITIGVPSIIEQSVLVPYDAGLRENNATFRLAYKYLLCNDSEEVNITGIVHYAAHNIQCR